MSLVSMGSTMTEYDIFNPLLATDVVLSRPKACLNVSCCVQNQFRSSPGMYSKVIKKTVFLNVSKMKVRNS